MVNNIITNEQILNASLSDNNFKIELKNSSKDVVFDELFNYLEIELNKYCNLEYTISTPLNHGNRMSCISRLAKNACCNCYENKNLNKVLYFMFGFDDVIHNKLYRLRIVIDRENRFKF